jgi:uncharacterized protein (DUF433 family)
MITYICQKVIGFVRFKEREQAMDWHERIIVNPKILVGKPVIKGTRIAVEFVVELLASGWTTQQILEEYDHLTSEDIQACLAYASEVLKSERVYLLPT